MRALAFFVVSWLTLALCVGVKRAAMFLGLALAAMVVLVVAFYAWGAFLGWIMEDDDV